jgi:acyl-CoA thioesterase-1
MRVVLALGVVVAVAVGAWACSPSREDNPASAPAPASAPPADTTPPAPPPVYVAVGASETTGIGAEAPLRDAWPRVLFRTAMPENTIFVNMGIPGATVAQALRDELPRAIEQRPTIATVWLNVNDLIAGVTPAEFERDLGTLVGTLRRGGATRVLVANTPPLDRLPAYLACRPDPPPSAPSCRYEGGLPPPDVVNALVDAYNAATARVVEREGAHLVDLHAVAMAARRAGIDQALISNDGFHPNAGGYQRVATAFAEVLHRTGPLGAGG